jgi:hypothetical protein
MNTRYFKVVDTDALKTLRDLMDRRLAAQETAEEFARRHGFKKAAFYRVGMHGVELAGFECTRFEHTKRADSDLWTIPKDGYTRVKVKKGSDLYESYAALMAAVRINSSFVDEVFGFSGYTYVPNRPGFTYRMDDQLAVFLMPDACNRVPGCAEISNIEYRELLHESDAEGSSDD